MKLFDAGAIKRTIVIGMQRGDDVLKCIQYAIKEYNIVQGAVLSGIGGLNTLSYHYVPDFADVPNNQFVSVDAPWELTSLQGTIVQGVEHIHVTACDDKGHTVGGHLEPGNIVLYVAEVVIVEFESGDFCRRADQFGLNYITNAE